MFLSLRITGILSLCEIIEVVPVVGSPTNERRYTLIIIFCKAHDLGRTGRESHHNTTSRMDRAAETLTVRYINLGCAKYARNEMKQATMAFSDALAMAEHIQDSEDDMKRPQHDSLGPFEPQFERHCFLKSLDSDFALFLYPISLQASVPCSKVKKTLLLIVLFNLAICNHRKAIESGKEGKRLRKALKLYELAYAIQMQEAIDMTLTATMIIMSNVGHIHKVLGNDDDATQCFQHLLSTLMFLVEAGERHMVSEFDGFFKNVLKTVYSNSPAAAA